MKNILCKLSIHNFRYYKERFKCTGLDFIKEIDVDIRECNCGLKQHHLMPRCNGNSSNWKPFNHKKGDTIHFKKI